MSENFDIGPLTWVKDQIDQSLGTVLDNLKTVQGNLHDTAPMRFSQTHLYQASGALDMVGLEGCKRFCAELEKLASRLEKKTLDATPELIDCFIKAVESLQSYLQDLLNGAPDIPLRLYPIIHPIVLALGETMDESELFFPDTSNSAPKDLPVKQLEAADYSAFIVEQRTGYQKSLLSWLQTKQNNALHSMTEAVSNVSQAQKKNSDKTLWWAASAFTESLEQKEIAENLGAKRLCRKLDQELRHLSEGVNKPHSNLLRDILYYVAISNVDRDNVQKVKEVFELNLLVDKKNAVSFDASSIDVNELAVVQDLITQLEALRELWDDVSNTIDFSKVDTNASLAQVHVDNVLITKFSDTLAVSQTLTQQLSQVVVIDVYTALQLASSTLRDDATKVNHAALIEVAATLNLLETSLNHYQHLDADRVQKLLSEMHRLEAISSGENYDKLDGDRTGELDRDTIKALVIQIKESLKTTEQALDSFFRNPAEKSPLALTTKPLKQIAAVFDMLGLATPTAIVKASSRLVEHFQMEDYVSNQQHFELVAESLSMVGIYADEMPKTRLESELALESAVTRLTSELAGAGIQFAAVSLDDVSISSDIAEYATNSNAESSEYLNEKHAEQATVTPSQLMTSPSDVKIIDQAFDAELLDIYLTEAEEVLAHIAQNCQALRVNATDSEALVEVRRSYHTLKGSGRTVGLNGMGDIAGQVEQFLNGVLDKKSILDQSQIAGIEQLSAAFADWAAELRANGQVEINQTAWSARAAALSQAAATEHTAIQETTEAAKAESINNENTQFKQESEPHLTPKKAKKSEPQVLIGGTRKMSRAFYDIFVKESMQNITILEQDVAKLIADTNLIPAQTAKVAIHTLASNALAAEFKPMGELGRALEAWLNDVEAWTPQHTELYSNTVKSLSTMWVKISELRNPRSARALIEVLNQAADQARQNKALIVTPSEVPEAVEEITFTLPSALQVETPASDLSNNATPTVELLSEPSAPNSDSEQVAIIHPTEIPTDAAVEFSHDDYEVELVTESKAYQDVSASDVDNSVEMDRTQVDQELLTMFIEEAREILPEIGTELRAWRAHPKQSEHPDALQRALHTLKGSARMAGQSGLGDAVHEMEDLVIRSLKRKTMDIDFDNMFVDLDKIGSFFEETLESTSVETINAIKQQDVPLASRVTDRKAQFLRMRADTLDRLINDAGEISIIRSRMDREISGVKQSSNDLTESVTRLRNYLRELEIEAETQLQSRLNILQESNENFDPLEFDRFTRLQELTRMIAESVNDVATIQHGLLTNLGQSEAALQQQNRMNRDLQQTLLGVRMLPFQQIAERLQRIVRQTARELKKSVDLVIVGETTEIDRSVLDKLGAPLEHLLRNAVAHGLELPAERKKQGKSEAGTIELKIRQENDEIHITVTDDGAGVNLQRVKEKAIKNKLIDETSEVTEQSLMSIIFESGFSTADKVSQIAGRGVGLDVVRNDISGLGGRVDLNSEFGKGTVFNVHLPVTLTVAQVLAVRSGDSIYALPVGMIEQAQKIKRQDLINAYSAGEINWAGKQYPIHDLSKLLDHEDHQPEDHAYASVLLLRSGTYNIALHIDEVIGNQEAVMKPIGAQLARVPGIVGATVAGDGKIMLIINPVQLANREILAVGSVVVKASKKAAKVVTRPRALVVDDSLTMRKVLGRLLEREGYEVLVAKDGMDAMQVLQQSTPDIILTDIEMPRMDGFGLARNIRDDARTAHTPLIMISSRTADKHQNLAKEIGVDAFFGKPVQDDELMSKVNELLAKKQTKH
ncbi:MAG: Hpt domain-containing protein [Pseudomonadota bacterium]